MSFIIHACLYFVRAFLLYQFRHVMHFGLFPYVFIDVCTSCFISVVSYVFISFDLPLFRSSSLSYFSVLFMFPLRLYFFMFIISLYPYMLALYVSMYFRVSLCISLFVSASSLCISSVMSLVISLCFSLLYLCRYVFMFLLFL